MTDRAAPGNWLDRLAVAHTRRQTLKAALAGAAMTLPFARPGPAPASNPNGAGPHDCAKGCQFTSHVHYRSRVATCRQQGISQGALAEGAALWLNPFYGVALQGGNLISYVRCNEQALLRQKAEGWDCLQPDCPGFDPYAPDGPCWACNEAGGKCCPSPQSATGYGCCASSICCDPATGGCKLSGC